MKHAYSVSEVAAILGVKVEEAKATAAQAFGVQRDVFGFQDLVLLRAVQGLAERSASDAEIAAAVEQLRGELTRSPERKEVGTALAAARWDAKTGQGVLDFSAPPVKERRVATLRPVRVPPRDADQLFSHAVQLEEASPADAVDAYAETLAANPLHADAHVNLGRLLHQRGRLREAEAHYVAAIVARPNDATAVFNLAVVLEDQGRVDDAIARYREAIETDPHCVDAYFNLSRLYERKGEKLAAIRHLKDYRRLTR